MARVSELEKPQPEDQPGLSLGHDVSTPKLLTSPIQAKCLAGVNGSPEPLEPLRLDLGVDGARAFHRNRTMIRAIIDGRLRRVWAILIGMSALAVTVGVVTIMIHDRTQ